MPMSLSAERLLLVLTFFVSSLAIPAYGTSPWTITDTISIPLTANATARLQTEYYRLNQWNVVTTETRQFHEEYFYPTASNRHNAGVHVMDAHKIGLGDFNGDGKRDMIISWATFPHVVEKPAIAPTILINQDGELKLSNDIWANEPPATMFAYKPGIADFNLDGVDDVVLGAFGILKRIADGSYQNTWERIPLMVSQGKQLANFSDRIAGQETGVIPGFTFAHDMAVGDVNGDGIPDFYQGRHLFIGDGTGRFTVRNDLLPPAARPGLHYVMSSAIGDLDNDGVDDLVIGVADGQPENQAVSGWIFLSNGQPNLANAKTIPLPEGRYGLLNTKHNSMNIDDLNGDGRLDIIIGQTKASPYYEGRQVQVLMNRGNGVFVDETDLRLAEAIRPQAQGEGISIVMDINGDGYPDIVDQSGGKPDDVAIMVNNGQGIFKRVPTAQLPIVQNFHLAGNEHWEGQDYGNSRTGYIYPIDLDGNGVASFIAQMFLNPARWPMQQGDANRSVIYTISPVKPFEPVPGPALLSDTECLFRWAERIEPGLLSDKNVQTQRLDGISYRHYPSTNTFLGFRANRVLLYQPSAGGAPADLGGVYQYLPIAREAGC